MALDARAFTAYERAAHDRLASTYAEHFAPLTCLALDQLLDTAEISQGCRVLDVATGPGLAAAAAQSRGATATGVDVSPGMLALAGQAHPDVIFQVADAVALPFPDGTFDRVICNFALGHFPEPEMALSECVRVLVPGGTLAFSWWDLPERQRVQGLFREVIAELGLPPPPGLPQGHDTLRFSNPDALAALLFSTGLEAVQTVPYRTVQPMVDLEALWQAGMGGMAVTAAAIVAQDAATQARAREVLGRRAETYRTERGIDVPIAYFIGKGRKPSGTGQLSRPPTR